MAVLTFVRDFIAFPTAYFSGTDYKDIEEKARNFLYSSARVMIACGIVYALHRTQHTESFRNLTIPTRLFHFDVGRFYFTVEPISLGITLYFVKSAVQLMQTAIPKWKAGVRLSLSELIAGTYLGDMGLRVWKTFVRMLQQAKAFAPAAFFSVSVVPGQFRMDPFSPLMYHAAFNIPESRLGISFFTTIFGIYQLNVYSMERWNLHEASTKIALYGIVHIIFGMGWWYLYEKYNDRLEVTQEKKNTYLYRVANWCAPYIAYVASGARG